LKFRKNSPLEPDINLIPFIDVLLVVLIFLMLTTTWSKFNELKLSLPSATSNIPSAENTHWVVSISAEGAYSVNGSPLEGRQAQDLQKALASSDSPDGSLLIKADASTSHQAVVNVLEAARLNGITKISFATQANTRPVSNKP